MSQLSDDIEQVRQFSRDAGILLPACPQQGEHAMHMVYRFIECADSSYLAIHVACDSCAIPATLIYVVPVAAMQGSQREAHLKAAQAAWVQAFQLKALEPA